MTSRIALTCIILFAVPAGAAGIDDKTNLLCSTYLSPDLGAPVGFNLGDRTASGKYLAFQPPNKAKRVVMDTNFMAFELISDLVPPLATTTTTGYSREFIADAAKLEWMVRKDDLLFSLNFGLMRGPMIELEPSLFPNGEISREFKTYLLEPIRHILAPLYDAYAKQGPERAELLPTIKRQDAEESSRFVRFILSRYVKPMGYVQVLTSKDASERLHVAQEWGDQVKDLVRRKPNELVGELGRLHIIHPNEYQFDYHRSNVTPLVNEDGKLHTNRVITHLLLQKMLSWVNSDARLDRLLIQINKQVERVMLINQIPLSLGERRVVKKTWADGRTVEEVIYAFDRKALFQLEDEMMRKTLLHWLNYIDGNSLFKVTELTPLKFFPNEYACLRRLRLYEAMNPGKRLPKTPEGDAHGFYLGRNQIAAAIQHLNSLPPEK